MCLRCPESPDWSRAELAAHAADTGHALCCVCQRSLPADRPQTCRSCTARALANLGDIDDAWGDLPAAAAERWGTGREHPGGDVLVMLAGGSKGRTGWAGVTLRDGRVDDSHGQDEWPGDPQSVAFDLSTWEDDFRAHRGEPATECPPAEAFPRAVAYLRRHHAWAATSHPAFDEYAEDLWRVRARMWGVLGLSDRPVQGAPCLRCSVDGRRVELEREWVNPERCEHDRPDLALQSRRTEVWDGGRSFPDVLEWHETVAERDARLEVWERAHSRCQQGGLADVWGCPRCGDTFTQADYVRMVAANVA